MGGALAAGLVGAGPGTAAAEAPPEKRRIRLAQTATLCWAPQYVAEELLRAEGFSEVAYVPIRGGVAKSLAEGQADIAMQFVGPTLISLDQGIPSVFLAGVHAGCFEVFATGSTRRPSELKGKRVAITSLNGPQHVFLASIAAHVGVDPRKEISWVVAAPDEAVRLLTDGKVDAFLGFPPTPQELRARKIGHVVIDSTTDRPWSQYFCCVVLGNREFVQRNPAATKRALRAILKGTDACAQQPDRVAQALVARGLSGSYDLALQVMRELPYGKWRELDPADTVRFYALRLHEAGMIKSSPQKLIAQGTDWRFLNELRKELKG
jgi:NitT/TauT family transport system substrate-binding protein